MAEFAPEDPFDAEGGLTVDTLTRGTRLGRYELLVPVATGGMAKVWAARQHGHRGFTKLVAIKTILPHLSRDPLFEKMFLDEARIAACVHHPNVCDIYELGEEGQVLYLAMEWVNGDSLVRLLRAAGPLVPIGPRLAARIGADACGGLHAAHEQSDDEGRPLGIVHRDVSPHNVLVTADGIVKVTDFGVAKAMGQMHDETAAGQLKGKLHYMAPEQISATHIDRRTDVFAMGSLLFEMTTGKHPFRGHSDHETMNNIVAGKCTLPSEVMPGFPSELEGIIVRALSNQPIRRFPTADRLRQALEEWLAMSGPIVPHSQVQVLLRARLGAKLDQRRDRIRAAMGTTGSLEDASRSGSTPPPSLAARSNSGVVAAGMSAGIDPPNPRTASIPDEVQLLSTPLASPPPGSAPPSTHAEATPRPLVRQYVLASTIGVVVAGLIAVSAWFLFRSASAASDAAAWEAPASPTQDELTNPAAPGLTSSAAPMAPSIVAAGEPTARSNASPDELPVVFVVVPETASLFIDGAPLAGGVKSIPHVKPGAAQTVVVRAPGFQDETITVDDSVRGPVDVVLAPSPPPSTNDPPR